MRAVHDNFVYAYVVVCDQREVVLHTEYRDGPGPEFTDVIFSGVVAHHFEDVLAGNILFDIEETELEQVVRESSDLFDQGKNYGWPDQIEYRDREHLVAILRQRGVKAFEIGSSLGLSGFLLAAQMELRPRDKRAVVS